MTPVIYVAFIIVAIGIGSYFSTKSDDVFVAYALGLLIGTLAVLV